MEQLPFNSLSEERQYEIAHGYIDNNDYWHEDIIRTIEEELSDLGFDAPSIRFSGFYSQGDGASFVSKYVDINQFIESEKTNMDFEFVNRTNINSDSEINEILDSIIEDNDNTTIKLLNDGFYSATLTSNTHQSVHENSVTLDIEMDRYYIEDEEDYMDRDITKATEHEVLSFYTYLDEYMSEWVVTKCKEIYGRLEKEWEGFKKAELDHHKDLNEMYNVV